jgi:hypothetical protein
MNYISTIGALKMIKNVIINEFRLFKNIDFNLGRYITIISGRNATGKSTILAMLANSSELKKKDGTPIIRNQFRGEFGDIFKGSNEFDLSGSNKFRINFCNNDFKDIIDYRDFRISWQNHGTRFRIIPYKKTVEGKRTERKKEWPILYFGLSRLFPIGESETNGLKSNKINLSKHDLNWFVEKYKYILSIHDEITDISSIAISETNKKKGVGINTEKYHHLTNSAGQDNAGQILCAVLSFKKLKEEKGKSYEGGMLLIDEVDATLHPAAQNRMIDFLISQCRKLDLQVVCTTHSLSLLKHICYKTRNNDDSVNNNVELLYFTNANMRLELYKNPAYTFIENELSVLSDVQNKRKIKIYTEDEENRWFLKKLINEYLPQVEMLDVNIGCNELLKLRKADLEYFSNVLIVLDGDVSEEVIEKEKAIGKLTIDNLLKLPGTERPEKVIYNYIINLPDDHIFLQNGMSRGFSKMYFLDNGPKSNDYEGNERERYKSWFQEHKNSFDILGLYNYWEKDNKKLVEDFKKKFVEAYNNIAYNLFIPQLPYYND